jgi:hypothetical protein
MAGSAGGTTDTWRRDTSSTWLAIATSSTSSAAAAQIRRAAPVSSVKVFNTNEEAMI